MFGFYGDKLLYGVLSLDGQGLREFGPASAVIDEKYISHRSTVTESDSVRMVASRFTTGVVPPGVISTWGEKHKLAVTKLANNIGPTTDADDFARLIRRGSNSDEGFGEFMEVQIYGSISRRSNQPHYALTRGAGTGLPTDCRGRSSSAKSGVVHRGPIRTRKVLVSLAAGGTSGAILKR